MEENLTIHQLIIMYLTGVSHTGRLKAMLGATDVVGGEIEYEGYKQPFLQFNFKMNPRLKVCQVIYEEGKDMFAMRFLNKAGKVVDDIKDLFFDDLQKTFEAKTGLYTRL